MSSTGISSTHRRGLYFARYICMVTCSGIVGLVLEMLGVIWLRPRKSLGQNQNRKAQTVTNELKNLVTDADLARELIRFVADPTARRYNHILGVQSADAYASDMAVRQQLALDIVAVLSRPLIRDAAADEARRARNRARAQLRRRKAQNDVMIEQNQSKGE